MLNKNIKRLMNINMKLLKSALKFWQEIIFIIELGLLVFGMTMNANWVFKHVFSIVSYCIFVSLLICLVGQFFWKKLILAFLLAILLGLGSMYMTFTWLIYFCKMTTADDGYLFAIFLLVLYIGLTITAFSMPFKYFKFGTIQRDNLVKFEMFKSMMNVIFPKNKRKMFYYAILLVIAFIGIANIIEHIKWELRATKTEYISLNRDYNWYIDQKHTGDASNYNCGPACAAMAAKWSDKSFSKSAIDARNTYPNNGKGWHMSVIHNFLTENKIPCVYIINKISEAAIKRHLIKGSIIIVSINTKHISYNNNPEQRTGKHYGSSFGHYIIIKGYRVMNNETYLEVYDPYTMDNFYSDGTPKGKDRYYLSDEVVYSKGNYIVVYPK